MPLRIIWLHLKTPLKINYTYKKYGVLLFDYYFQNKSCLYLGIKSKQCLLRLCTLTQPQHSICVESFSNFKDDYERKEMWELELAVREVYKGPLPFVWSQWDYGLAWPTVSYEYETNWRAVQDFEKLCVFIKEIKYYID